MPRYNVIHGSVTVGFKDGNPVVANIGEVVNLTPEQAAAPIANGFIADEKQFTNLKAMIQAASRAGAIQTLDKKSQKLAAGLNIRNEAPAGDEAEEEKAPEKTEKAPEKTEKGK